MAKIQALSPQQHIKTSVDTEFSADLGYNQGAVMVMPCELREAQREYPILFRKHPETGHFFPTLLLGFEQDENLYINANNQWQAEYIPMTFRKGPFLIGFRQNGNGNVPIISIDMDDPRVSEDGENRLFESDGQASPYLDGINDILLQMHENNDVMASMVDAFQQLNLIEPLSLDIELENGAKVSFSGAYTIAEEKLQALTGSDLEKLNTSGFLSAAYYISGSLANVKKLIHFKNNKSAE